MDRSKSGSRLFQAPKARTFLWIILLSVQVYGGAKPIQPGIYGEMALGYDPTTQKVAGYFDSATGQDNQFTCIFYFEGILRDSTARIESFSPATPRDRITGVLSVAKKGSFAVHLDQDHGGCANVRLFADASQPAVFDLDAAYPWKAIRVTSSPQTFVYRLANAKGPPKGLPLPRGTALGVREFKKPFLRVDAIVGGKLRSGWVLESDCYGVWPIRHKAGG